MRSRTASRFYRTLGTFVAFPPKRDIRGLRTPAEGMSVARMVVIRRFCVSAFRRLVFAQRDREDQIPVARALLPPRNRAEVVAAMASRGRPQEPAS
jgi:hypothetical protein